MSVDRQLRVFLDNTGVHSAGRCLDRTARGPADVAGLLQLCSAIVFAEELVYSDRESSPVRERTAEVLERIHDIGFDRHKVQRASLTEREWDGFCREVGDEFALDLDDLMPLAKVGPEVTALAPDLGLDTGPPDGEVHELIAGELSSSRLEELGAQARELKGRGLVAYTLYRNRDLLERLRSRRVSGKDDWSIWDTSRLAAMLRVYGNTSVAQRLKALYLPSVARGELLRGHATVVLNRLLGTMAEAASALTETSVGIPSVLLAIVGECKGHPEAAIEQALALREKAGGVRALLQRHTELLAGGQSVEAQAELGREIAHIRKILHRELGLSPAPGLAGAFDVTFILGLPAPSLSGKALLRWVRNRWQRRKVAVLTELSRRAAFQVKRARLLRQLLAASGVK